MVTRRAFVTAGAAALAADWRLWAAEEGLPAYYGEHLADVARKVARLKAACCDGFWFLTDLHIPSNRCVSGKGPRRWCGTSSISAAVISPCLGVPATSRSRSAST
jgi:hypothetical protein